MKQWLLRCGMVVALGLGVPLAAHGQAVPAQLRALGDALNMDMTFDIMQREALDNSRDLAADLFTGSDVDAYLATVTDLFDPAAARRQFDAGLMAAAGQIEAAHIDASIAFFTSPLGAKIVALELSARKAMLDGATKSAAEEAWADALRAKLPADAIRAKLVQDIVAANDLIETNVTAGLNSNLAFYEGMSEGGAFGAPMTQDQMLSEVAGQEGEVRQDTENWLYPFLALAYQPLSVEDLQTYIDFSKSQAGRSLTKLLFASFDTLGRAQSRGMGQAAGRLLAGQDI